MSMYDMGLFASWDRYCRQEEERAEAMEREITKVAMSKLQSLLKDHAASLWDQIGPEVIEDVCEAAANHGGEFTERDVASAIGHIILKKLGADT